MPKRGHMIFILRYRRMLLGGAVVLACFIGIFLVRACSCGGQCGYMADNTFGMDNGTGSWLVMYNNDVGGGTIA